jgi:hypothetical protein
VPSSRPCNTGNAIVAEMDCALPSRKPTFTRHQVVDRPVDVAGPDPEIGPRIEHPGERTHPLDFTERHGLVERRPLAGSNQWKTERRLAHGFSNEVEYRPVLFEPRFHHRQVVERPGRENFLIQCIGLFLI